MISKIMTLFEESMKSKQSNDSSSIIANGSGHADCNFFEVFISYVVIHAVLNFFSRRFSACSLPDSKVPYAEKSEIKSLVVLTVQYEIHPLMMKKLKPKQ